MSASELNFNYLIENATKLKLQVTLDHPEIAAHFPGRPIVAAYMQMNWVEFLYKQDLTNPKLIGIRDVKFRSPIVPPCEVEISIDKTLLKFEIRVADKIKTAGKLILE